MSNQQPITTTDGGSPVASDEYSLTVAPNGPVLLQDYYLIEKLARFNAATWELAGRLLLGQPTETTML